MEKAEKEAMMKGFTLALEWIERERPCQSMRCHNVSHEIWNDIRARLFHDGVEKGLFE